MVSIRGVVIYSSLMGSGLRLSNTYMDGYPWFVSNQSKFTSANKGGNVIPDFKDKTRYAPYVSFRSQVSPTTTNKG